MAYEETLRSVSLDADASLAGYTGPPGVVGSTAPNWGKQFRFVTVTGEHQVGLVTGAEMVCGVVQNKPQRLGEAATVATHGISMMQSGSALAPGIGVKSDGTGRAVAATGSDVVLGVTVGTAAAADQLVPVLLKIN